MIACLTFVCLVASAAADEPKSDLDRLQGTWDLVTYRFKGKEPLRVDGKERSISGGRIRISGDKYIPMPTPRLPEVRHTLKLDEGRKQYDLIIDGVVCKGLYRIEGDTWEVCQGEPGGDRPTEFRARHGDKQIIK